MKTITKLIGFTLTLLWVHLANAHDIWLAPEPFILSQGERLTVHQFVGHDDLVAEQELPLLGGLTRAFKMITPDGPVDLLRGRTEGRLPVLKRKLDFEGTALLIMEHDFKHVELAREKFSEHLELEQLEEIERIRGKTKLKPTERERYARTLKSLIQVGKPSTQQTYRQITDSDLKYLEGMSNIKALDLYATQVTDAGLAHLQGLTQMKTLELGYTSVTNAGLAHLKNLTKLQVLGLDGTQVTDAGLAHLQGLTHLAYLYLGGTQVTEAGLAQLQKGLTNLKTADPHPTAMRRSMPSMQPFGQKIDLRLLQNPYLLNPGDDLDVQVFFDGQPLRGKLVWAYNKNASQPACRLQAHTNQRGVARFKLEREGFWLIRLVHMLPCTEWPDVDWESYWTSYSFQLD